MSSELAVCVENLSKKYFLKHPIVNESGKEVHEFWALKDISFEIKKGESVGIVGPNGSGKSTLLKILAGVTKPTTGQIQIFGRVASILDIGAGFHPELSGRENVLLNGQIHGFTKKEIKSKFDEIVAFSGIEKFIDEPVKNYSNGMYLRLAFSIMVHLDFDVYLLDEVLSVGDDEFKIKAQEALYKLTDQEKTIIVISHEIKALVNLTTRLISFPTLEIVNNIKKFDSGSPKQKYALIESYEVNMNRNDDNIDISVQLKLKDEINYIIDVVIIFKSSNHLDSVGISSLHDLGNTTRNSANNKTLFYSTKVKYDFINPDNYSINLILIKDRVEIIAKIDNCLNIKIDSSSNSDDFFFNSYPGVVKLLSSWNYNTNN